MSVGTIVIDWCQFNSAMITARRNSDHFVGPLLNLQVRSPAVRG
ncbi:MAG: hypothetical protein ACYCZD_13025 [Rhodanobacter sp.]